MGKYLLGIDNGGTMTKASVFDLAGNELASVGEKTPINIPQEGYAQRDMDELWEANARVIRGAIEKAGICSGDIAGVGCTGHGKGLYLWGYDDKPCGQAIASTDNRAGEYIEKWNKTGISEAAGKKTFHYPIACQPVVLLAWIKDNQPERYDSIRWIFMAKDFTRFKLTGKAFAERTDYSGTGMMNLQTENFDRELFTLFGIPEMYEKLPPLANSHDLCGFVSEEAAKQTGLREGTPVCGGMFDIDACAVAMDILEEEKLCIITGTWSINEYISKSPVRTVKTTLNSLFCIPGYYLIEESSPTSAGNLEWFIDNLMKPHIKEAKEDDNALTYKDIDDMVSSALQEESDVIFIPFLYGSNHEGLHNAGFMGLTNKTGKKHLLRAIYEGVVFSHMTHIERLLLAREKPDVIRIGGGATRSHTWVSLFADIIGIPLEIIGAQELGTLGCAMAAGVAVGIFEDYSHAAKEMVKVSKRIIPNREKHLIYQAKYERYKSIISALGSV